MSVRQAVTRAMRSGHVITPNEFPAIQGEAVASLDIGQLHSGDYLIRGEDAEALRAAHFRNAEEQRDFYLGLLHQVRDRVLVQLVQAMRAVPAGEATATLGCRRRGQDGSFHAENCFGERDGQVYLWPSAAVTGTTEPPSVTET